MGKFTTKRGGGKPLLLLTPTVPRAVEGWTRGGIVYNSSLSPARGTLGGQSNTKCRKGELTDGPRRVVAPDLD